MNECIECGTEFEEGESEEFCSFGCAAEYFERRNIAEEEE